MVGTGSERTAHNYFSASLLGYNHYVQGQGFRNRTISYFLKMKASRNAATGHIRIAARHRRYIIEIPRPLYELPVFEYGV